MICKKCGKSIEDCSVFCNFCGKKQEVEESKSQKRGNGAGSIYKRGKTYRAMVFLGLDENGKQIRKVKSGFATKRDAEEWLYSVRLNPETLDKKTRTVQSLWNTFSNGVMLKTGKDTQSHYRTAYNRLKSIYFRDIQTIKTNDIQEIVDQRGDDYYPARYIRDLMSKLFAIAISEGVVNFNPTQYVALPEHATEPHKPFTKEDIDKMWKAYEDGDDICGYMLLMCYSGMMPGELFNVTKEMIDLEHHVIIGAGAKTKIRRETPIVLCDLITPVVERLVNNSDDVFLWPHCRDFFYDEFRDTIKKHGLSDLKPYSCRHTTAHMLGQLEINDSTAKKAMRHQTMQMTEYYMDKGVQEMLGALNKLPGLHIVEE